MLQPQPHSEYIVSISRYITLLIVNRAFLTEGLHRCWAATASVPQNHSNLLRSLSAWSSVSVHVQQTSGSNAVLTLCRLYR
jgi:hypothetical protein